MGKNLPAKKYKVGNRTERFLHYELSHTGSSTDSHFIDLAAGLCAVNKRAYRQGLYYYIKSISVVETTKPTKIQFGTAPDVWQVPQAWKMGFRAWSKMNSIAAQNIPGGDLKIAGQYHDFKIFLNNNHRTEHLNDPQLDVTVPTNGPASMDGDPHENVTDWDYSVLHSMDPNGNNAPADAFHIMLLGNHQGSDNAYDAVSLVKSYVNSKRKQEAQPLLLEESMEADPLVNMFDISDTADDVIEDLQDFNDQPPYDGDGVYSDTILRAQGYASPGNAGLMLPGFCVPFGILEVLTNCGENNDVKILVEMAPGPYHGVYAERIV